jgi:hypothetical protein
MAKQEHKRRNDINQCHKYNKKRSMAKGDERYISEDNGDNGSKPSNKVKKVVGTKLWFFQWYARDLSLSNNGSLVWIYLAPDKNNERNVAGASQQLKPNVQHQELYKTTNV